MVKVKSVSKQYNDVNVIDDVSIQIEPGTITSFIGPNGAGKSTLISMISRLISRDAGDITIDGKDIADIKDSELAKKISILKQTNTTHVKLTVKELVSFGRFPHSQGRLKKGDWEKINKAIDYMELDPIKDKYLDELSGGQRQEHILQWF